MKVNGYSIKEGDVWVNGVGSEITITKIFTEGGAYPIKGSNSEFRSISYTKDGYYTDNEDSTLNLVKPLWAFNEGLCTESDAEGYKFKVGDCFVEGDKCEYYGVIAEVMDNTTVGHAFFADTVTKQIRDSYGRSTLKSHGDYKLITVEEFFKGAFANCVVSTEGLCNKVKDIIPEDNKDKFDNLVNYLDFKLDESRNEVDTYHYKVGDCVLETVGSSSVKYYGLVTRATDQIKCYFFYLNTPNVEYKRLDGSSIGVETDTLQLIDYKMFVEGALDRYDDDIRLLARHIKELVTDDESFSELVEYLDELVARHEANLNWIEPKDTEILEESLTPVADAIEAVGSALGIESGMLGTILNTEALASGETQRELSAKYEKFRKDDKGKPRMSLIDPYYSEETAMVLTHGASKYGDYNWQKCEDIDRIIDSLERHINDYKKGIIYDLETGKHQMAHISCNAMFIHYFDRTRKDRSPLGFDVARMDEGY